MLPSFGTTEKSLCYIPYAALSRYAENLKPELPRIPLVPPAEAAPSPPTPLPDSLAALGGRGETTENSTDVPTEATTQVTPVPIANAAQRFAALPVSAANEVGKGAGGLGDFRRYATIGKELMRLHLEYEIAAEYRLEWIENRDVSFSWRVEKMRLSKDKTQIVVNESLTLAGIPPETFAYRLGNRSALEWVLDQYQVTTDKRSGIVSDPNRPDDPEYIVRLVGKSSPPVWKPSVSSRNYAKTRQRSHRRRNLFVSAGYGA